MPKKDTEDREQGARSAVGAPIPWKCESCGAVVRMPPGGEIPKIHEHAKRCHGNLIRPPLETPPGERVDNLEEKATE